MTRHLATLVWSALVGVLCGCASWAFLALLAAATGWRGGHIGVVYLLPVAGLLLGWVYERFGRSVLPGNNLVIETIETGGPQIPRRMAPMILLGTVATHLFGGSAGREGTAVQMGASLADWVAHRVAADGTMRRQLVVAGVAGGFGSVFGTPVAGAVFAMEFVVRGQLRTRALVPAVVASLVGDQVARALGTPHAAFTQSPSVLMTPLLAAKWVVFAAAVAAVVVAFVWFTDRIREQSRARLGRLPWRMSAGGIAVILLWTLAGSDDYLGLGVPTILRAFDDPGLPAAAFAWKLVFTAVTLGSGFLGGEVTPLFFLGAALGNTLAQLLGLPLALGAGAGMAAAFGAASKTPLAMTIMAVEMLGGGALPHVALVCFVAYALSGRWTIYAAQRDAACPDGGAAPHAGPGAGA